jgi:hypothetical protein
MFFDERHNPICGKKSVLPPPDMAFDPARQTLDKAGRTQAEQHTSGALPKIDRG